jgi:cyanoexosortase A
MKAIHLTSLKPLKNSQFWLLGIGAGLIAIHLSLMERANNPSLLGISVLFWSAVASLVWQKRHSLNLESGIFSSVIGALLLSLVLLKSLSFSGYDFFLRISPLIGAIGLSLLASGTKGLKQYWQEILSLSFFIVSPGMLSSLIEPSIFTAKFSAFLLWYAGFKVSLQGVHIILPTGRVEVYPGCSGIENITHLLGLAMLFLVMFPPLNCSLKS